jgi:predicted signal transduction protein with EAL and GGDEF domain
MLVLMDAHDRTQAVSLPEVNERLGEAMEQAERHGERLAVLSLRLEAEPGAERQAVRAQVWLRLARTLRATDEVLAGGTERLLILLPGVESVGDAAIVAGKVLAALAEPLAVEGRMLRVEGRIGLALYPDHGFDPDALLRNAEEAMRRAEGDSRWHAPRSTVSSPDDLAG